MNSKKPRILVTGSDERSEILWLAMKFNIWLAGGQAIRMNPKNYRSGDQPEFDGLLLGGGADIDPALYDQEPIYPPRPVTSYSGFYDKLRDAMECDLLQLALARRLPVLGICRGCQFINVMLGGSLEQDISRHYTTYPKRRTALPRKPVVVERSHLRDVLQTESLNVNSFHSQAIDRSASTLNVVSRERNGVIQGIESQDPYQTLLGVQWHPELMPYKAEQRRLFNWLVGEAIRAKVRNAANYARAALEK